LAGLAEQELIQAVRAFASDPEADELEAAVLVNRALEPSLDADTLRGRIAELAAACPETQTPWDYLRELGFVGNAANYDALDNSRLDRLLDTRRGIPIALGVLLIEVARASGRMAVGVNFPGHFLVRVGESLVDPFRMTQTSEDECVAGLGQARGNPGAGGDLFPSATAAAVLLRMLNNIKYRYAQAGEWHRSLDMVDLQLAAAGESAHLLLERGELWLRLGARGPARADLERALALAGDGDPRLAAAARRLLDGLGSDPELLH
jgi:regulator of sirC expression with transglutaminase-like and TPR domain